ncbi:hypothetical protein ACI2OX_20915 [Bacillus sp. N9]
MATGKAESFEQIKETVVLGEAITPNEDRHQKYQEIYNNYKNLVQTIAK